MASSVRHVAVGILGRDERGYYLLLAGGGRWRLSFEHPPIFIGARLAIEGWSRDNHTLFVSAYHLIDMGLDYPPKDMTVAPERQI